LVTTGLIVTGAVLLTSCSSSGGGGTPGTSPNSGTSSSGPSPVATVATAAAGTPADAATKAAVINAFKAFFDYQSTLAQSQGALQQGSLFTAALNEQGAQSYAQKSAATVSSVKLISPNTAKVIFSVLVSGQPLLPDAPGFAVRENGTWKVAATTFCSLLTLEGDKADACQSPAVTALPK
jgi:hypothetical protein